MFKLMDSDFDENISKQDLSNFLANTLKVHREELTIVNLNRLYQLLDVN